MLFESVAEKLKSTGDHQIVIEYYTHAYNTASHSYVLDEYTHSIAGKLARCNMSGGNYVDSLYWTKQSKDDKIMIKWRNKFYSPEIIKVFF